MRVVRNTQIQIGEIDVSQIKFDLRSRDDIPKVLRGLQHLYMNEPLRTRIFALLENKIAPGKDKNNGRPGMTLWRILVLGVLRLDLNIDYDRLLELSNQHRTLRQMLGHGLFDEDKKYACQILVDNVGLLTPKLLDKLNQIIVEEGHILVKKGGAALRGRCDSFVVETDVHFPTDISLLWDVMRKAITLTAQWSESQRCSNWRQYRYNLRQLKRKLRAAQQALSIPHEEKVFSIFEPHTEWVSKGKAGVPVELGVKVCILEDQHQFILHHHIMTKQTDACVAVDMVTEARKRFPTLNACSFDKGFHSPANQTELSQQLDQVTLPKKGKLSKTRQAVEQAEEFAKARRAHSAVESAIHALEVHGLDKCPDHGINGFKRYVALAVVARNIHRIGDILWQQDVKRERKTNKRNSRYRRAA